MTRTGTIDRPDYHAISTGAAYYFSRAKATVAAASTLRPWTQSIYTGGLGRIQSAPSFRRIYFMRATSFFSMERAPSGCVHSFFVNHHGCNDLNRRRR
jgi:hypothetical protein